MTRRCFTAVAGFLVCGTTLLEPASGRADTAAQRGAVEPGAAAPRPPQVTARLIAGRTVAVPGTSLPVGVALMVAPGWHIYWLNPGDAGIPTRVEWAASPKVRLEPVQWPAPARFKEQEGFEALGYGGEVVLPSQATIAADASGAVVLEGSVTWLACKDDCVKGGAPVKLTLPTTGTPTRMPDAARIEAGLARVPRPSAVSDPFQLQLAAPATLAQGESGAVVVRLEPAEKKPGAVAEGDLELEAIYLNADLTVTVGHEERLSKRSIQLAVSIPASYGPEPGNLLADGLIAQVRTVRDGQPGTSYVRLEVPTRVAPPTTP